MKNPHSLEEERQALLEQIHASRAVYRRMLTNSDTSDASESSGTYSISSTEAIDHPKKFPRSKTMKWVMDHPYLTALAAAAIVALGPRTIVRNVINRGTVTTGLTAVTTMLLRSPSKARLAGKAVSMIARFMQRSAARRR